MMFEDVEPFIPRLEKVEIKKPNGNYKPYVYRWLNQDWHSPTPIKKQASNNTNNKK